MSNKIISLKHNPVERVAFDMALVLATKNSSASTPEALMAEIVALYPECYEVADGRRRLEYFGTQVKLHRVL